MVTPEPTPAQKALKRVRAIARVNGWSIAIFGGLSVLLALALGDVSSMAIGVLVAVAGAMEIRGGRKLGRRDPEGMKLLVRSQMFLLAIILVYCATRLGSFDAETMMGNVTPDMEALLKESGITRAEILPLVRLVFYAVYLTVAVVCLFYQGGMAIYYRRKTRLVTAALQELPVVPPNSPLA
jgi:hypothetical protein